VIERLQTKVAVIETLLRESNNDWNQVAFEMIATYFGASVNKEPFGLLARHLPLQLIHKHRDSPLQIEALVFGVAGMLEGHFDDDYPNSLKREFQYLKRLHSLTSIAPESWKYFRIRPVNFPTIKLAQLASLLTHQPFLFASMLECSTIEQLRALFHVTIDPYWLTHYQWDKPVGKVNTQLGDMLVEIVLINAVVPLLFSYARYRGDESIGSHALELLGALPAEKNHITKIWDSLRIKAYNASESQSLIQLKREYCEAFRCLDCEVGHRLLGAATARQ
jgi:hypothetical protein